jgi:hypothetical protein
VWQCVSECACGNTYVSESESVSICMCICIRECVKGRCAIVCERVEVAGGYIYNDTISPCHGALSPYNRQHEKLLHSRHSASS